MNFWAFLMVVVFVAILFYCFRTIGEINDRMDRAIRYQRKLQEENHDLRAEIRGLKRDIDNNPYHSTTADGA